MNDTSISPIKIRDATLDDAEACLLVHREAAVVGFAHIFPRDLYPFPEEQMRIRWRKLCEVGHVLVAEQAGAIIGTAAYDASDFRSFFVLPQHWGSGVAQDLYETVLDRVRMRGDKVFHLWVLEENSRARRFYEKRGWRLTGQWKWTPFPPQPKLLQYRIEL